MGWAWGLGDGLLMGRGGEADGDVDGGHDGLVVRLRVGAGWTEDGAEAVVMGDRGGNEDVEAEGVKVGVTSLGMGMRGGGGRPGRWRWLGSDGWLEPRRGHPARIPAPQTPPALWPESPARRWRRLQRRRPKLRWRVTLRAARDSGCGRVGGLGTRPGEGGGAGPGRRARRRRGRTGAGRSCGHRCPGSPATALARTARAAAPGAGTRLLPQPPPRRARHRPVSQEPAGRLPAPPAARAPRAPGRCSPSPGREDGLGPCRRAGARLGLAAPESGPSQDAGGAWGAGGRVSGFSPGCRMAADHLGAPSPADDDQIPPPPGYSKPPSVTPHPLLSPLQPPSLSPQ